MNHSPPHHNHHNHHQSHHYDHDHNQIQNHDQHHDHDQQAAHLISVMSSPRSTSVSLVSMRSPSQRGAENNIVLFPHIFFFFSPHFHISQVCVCEPPPSPSVLFSGKFRLTDFLTLLKPDPFNPCPSVEGISFSTALRKANIRECR